MRVRSEERVGFYEHMHQREREPEKEQERERESLRALNMCTSEGEIVGESSDGKRDPFESAKTEL